MRLTRWIAVVSMALVLGMVQSISAADARASREMASFGSLRSPADDAVRAQAEAWLKSTGKGDAAGLKKLADAWDSGLPLLDKVANVLSIDDDARKLLAETADADTAAPQTVPGILKDAKKPAFFRANLALTYAKTLANRKIYEEGLEALKAVKPEEVVDPAAFYFTKAVAEHALMMKPEATNSIARLLDDVADAPERYRMVAALMHFDMMTWQEKDLGWISRKMDNIQRRLELQRGGKKTQKMQKEVLARLDEMIKQMENECKGNCQCNGGSCPNGGQKKNGPNSMMPSTPLDDSQLGGRSGPGNIDPKKFKELADVWGKLPEKERAKALVDLTRKLDPRYRDVVETYFKKMATADASK